RTKAETVHREVTAEIDGARSVG
ncbi:MAG: hypothetical protein QOG30_640, partial [Acidimicrobiaceae bacterium]